MEAFSSIVVVGISAHKNRCISMYAYQETFKSSLDRESWVFESEWREWRLSLRGWGWRAIRAGTSLVIATATISTSVSSLRGNLGRHFPFFHGSAQSEREAEGANEADGEKNF